MSTSSILSMIWTVRLTRSSWRPWRTLKFLSLGEGLGLLCLKTAKKLNSSQRPTDVISHPGLEKKLLWTQM
ncbi:hypothetical protein LINPERPRIM_LOCUS29378 [Linum perenne]